MQNTPTLRREVEIDTEIADAYEAYVNAGFVLFRECTYSQSAIHATVWNSRMTGANEPEVVEQGKAWMLGTDHRSNLLSLDALIERMTAILAYEVEWTHGTSDYRFSLGYNARGLDARLASLVEASDAYQAAKVAFKQAETRYEGWSRFFLVPDGHIHSSMNCSTCNRGRFPTRFGWLPRLSGSTEAEAVESEGALLCTRCYPSAPVEWQWTKESAKAANAARKARAAA